MTIQQIEYFLQLADELHWRKDDDNGVVRNIVALIAAD